MLEKKTPKAVVVTPSIGTPHLRQAVESVLGQTFNDILHFILVDGAEFGDKVFKRLEGLASEKIETLILPFNTGRNGFNGHRIYAACPYLLDCDYVFFLDEDNWYDANHVCSLIELMEQENLEWAYSLRKICNHDSAFIAEDNCESLGRWPGWLRHSKPPHSEHPNLVDTSCYAFRREVLAGVSHFWNHPLGADRVFFKQISNRFPFFRSTGLYTLNYRLHQNRPPYARYFHFGNRVMLKRLEGNLPWKYR